MFNSVSFRDPVLINTIGHTAGVLLFGFIVALLIGDCRKRGIRPIQLSIVAATLALGWNIGSLVALAWDGANSVFIGIIVTASFSVLSSLPAVLLQVALQGEHLAITKAGYLVSAVAVLLHVSEIFTPSPARHQLALVLTAVGFDILTVIAFLARRRRPQAGQTNETTEWLSLASLFLFATSFVHFGYQHFGSPWTAEIAWHHIGIPVALIILLQDYRFLLLDTFIRFLMNSGLAASYIAVILLLNRQFRHSDLLSRSRFETGILLVCLCISLILFAHVRNLLQRWIGRAIFRRKSLDECLKAITRLSAIAQSDEELLTESAREVAAHVGTNQFRIVKEIARSQAPDQPRVLLGQPRLPELIWAEVQVPLRFSSGEVFYLVTGPRRGRQRYLSEDLEDMRRLGSVIVEQVERFRSEELKRLVAQAELNALQAQINPHFLFNALNTLYGIIDRHSYEARRTVLNLADIFRYSLQGNRSSISLSEELKIVQAYLEIESLRLGDRLETDLQVAESALGVMIPVLSIEPLVENAVKHGIAPKDGSGRITLKATVEEGNLHVVVEDTGVGFAASALRGPQGGSGSGLENVRRRLKLSYGPAVVLTILSNESGSNVSFRIPASPATNNAPDYSRVRGQFTGAPASA